MDDDVETLIAQLSDDQLLMPGTVAPWFGVNSKTITRWTDKGKLTGKRTLGGHRRVTGESVKALLREQADQNEG